MWSGAVRREDGDAYASYCRPAVTAFAGTEPERAVFYPQDDRYLVERDLTVAHYQVDTAVLDPALHLAGPPGGPAGTSRAPA
jgi:hypothetical protein